MSNFLQSPIFSLTSMMKVCRIISMSNVRYYFNVEMMRYVNIGGNMTPSLLTPNYEYKSSLIKPKRI